jgi:2-deoxy-D-gluconate 3-dehydrogenase
MTSGMFRLDGKVALVTGASRGLGAAMALALAEAGADVVLHASARPAEMTASEVAARTGRRTSLLTADLSAPAAAADLVARAVGAFGRLDILVNNAGTNIRKRPEEYSLEEYNTVLETNLTSAFVCSQAAYPHMVRAGGGKVINIGSMMSIFGAAFTTPYAASKGGIVQMTKAMATAWAKDNIQVNAVLPGWIDTDLTKKAREQVPGLHDRVVARTPAGRWGTPEDHAGVAVFLASAASDFVTGTAIPVDGGYSIQGV